MGAREIQNDQGFTSSNHRNRKLRSRGKLNRGRSTNPKSIIHHPSLVAPPRGASDRLNTMTRTSVNPHTVASFNKLKIQVQLARRADKHRRRKAKLEDRLVDVQGYRDLWDNYEEIENQVCKSAQGDAQHTPRSFQENLNLKKPNSWYFDFQSLDEGEDVDDDNRSQSSLSLHSEASMETQRRLFQEKRRARRRRSRSKSSRSSKRSTSEDRAYAKPVPSKQSACDRHRDAVNFINDYGPHDRAVYNASLVHLGASMSGDDSTPRARSRSRRTDSDDISRGTDDGSFLSDFDYDNDYNVPPRRRRHAKHNNDDSSISTHDDLSVHSSVSDGFRSTHSNPVNQGYMLTPRSIEVRRSGQKVKNGKERYSFDPSVPRFSITGNRSVHMLPSVQIEAGEIRWRQENPPREQSERYSESEASTREEIDVVSQAKNAVSTLLDHRRSTIKPTSIEIRANAQPSIGDTQVSGLVNREEASKSHKTIDETALEVSTKESQYENRGRKDKYSSYTNNYDPEIALMSTTEFLRFSSEHGIGRKVNSNEPGALQEMPSSASAKVMACEGYNSSRSKTSACSLEEPSVQPDDGLTECNDELAEQVSRTVDRVLAKFRESSENV